MDRSAEGDAPTSTASDLSGDRAGAVTELLGRIACRLAVRSSRSKRLGNLIVGVGASLAFVLAMVGLHQWDVENPEVSLSLGALIAGAFGLFGIGGSPPLRISDTVPLAWDLARLLAPLATAGAVVSVFLAIGEERLHRVAAHRARGHLLLVGPADRVSGYEDAMARELTVHATTDGHHLDGGVVRASVDPAIDGWSRVAGAEASTVVVATGEDELNLALCASLWGILADQPGLDVLVEIDDHETAIRLATALASEDPTRRVEIVCRSDLIVERATAVMLDAGGTQRPVLIAGTGDLVAPVADGIAQRLWDEVQADGRSRQRIALLSTGRSGADRLGERFGDEAAFEVLRCSSIVDVLAWEPGPLAAFMDFERPADTLRFALSLNDDRPGSVICVPSSGADLPGGLVPLDQGSAARAGRSAGMWARVATDLWPRLRGEDDAPAWAEALQQVRNGVAALVSDPRWQVVPSPEVHGGVTLLSSAEVATLGIEEDLRQLPLALRRCGLVVRRAGRETQDSAEHRASVSMVDDEVIEQIAERIHASYLERLDARDQDLPANQPWDRLAPVQRAMNRQQARENVVRLARLGLEVVTALPDDEGTLVHSIGDGDVERLAREEHDRWSRQKYAQGYRYGPERNDTSPLTHPDLLAWDDLSDEDRDKDREPIREIVPGIEGVGLFVTRDPGASLARRGEQGS